MAADDGLLLGCDVRVAVSTLVLGYWAWHGGEWLVSLVRGRVGEGSLGIPTVANLVTESIDYIGEDSEMVDEDRSSLSLSLSLSLSGDSKLVDDERGGSRVAAAAGGRRQPGCGVQYLQQ